MTTTVSSATPVTSTSLAFPAIRRGSLTTLQVNLGYRCNQSCSHCHVGAGPSRTEMMEQATLELIPRVLLARGISCLDITGGAPELHPGFRDLVRAGRQAGAAVAASGRAAPARAMSATTLSIGGSLASEFGRSYGADSEILGMLRRAPPYVGGPGVQATCRRPC